MKRGEHKMGKTVIMDHPLIQHKIGLIRSKDTGSKDFRELVGEIATLECYEATRNLELEEYPVETPMGHTI
jgi:uracil phosphoribosyltransferase